MDVYVARQPIFDRNMNVFGYELLYRGRLYNFYEGSDENKSTAELISNSFLTMGINDLTDGTKAFINFPQQMLIEEIPFLLPADSVVVEVLENVEVNDSLIQACRKLRDNGYIIALDDFAINDSYLPLLEIAHMVKIEFSAVNYAEQRQLIKQYKDRIIFLAEKVESREEYKRALDMGYDLFQGYFFSKPVIIQGKEIDSLNLNLVKIMGELNKGEPEYEQIEEIIRNDIGLTYKLLKLANSAFFGSRNEIFSIRQALVQLGILELRKWIYVMMLKDIQIIENKELIKTCFIRAKLMELLATEIGNYNRRLEYFITGMFSSIDVLLNKDMNLIVNEIVLTNDVKDALLGVDNEIKNVLDLVINYEKLKWEVLKNNKIAHRITRDKFMNLYIRALMWARKLGY